MKNFHILLLIVVGLLTTACATTGSNGGIIPLPAGLQDKADTACAKIEDFEARYLKVRPQVIENREWFEELLPEFWDLLVDFDKDAPVYRDAVAIICRLIGGDASAQVELDALGVEMTKSGRDWPALLAKALRVALMLMAGA